MKGGKLNVNICVLLSNYLISIPFFQASWQTEDICKMEILDRCHIIGLSEAAVPNITSRAPPDQAGVSGPLPLPSNRNKINKDD
jgi:hypothetical protein